MFILLEFHISTVTSTCCCLQRKCSLRMCVGERTPAGLNPFPEDQGSSHHSGGNSHGEKLCNKSHQESSQNASCCEVATLRPSQNASCCEVATLQSSQNASCCKVATLQSSQNASCCEVATLQSSQNASCCEVATLQSSQNVPCYEAALVPDGRIQGRWTQKWPSKISCGLGNQRPNSKFPNCSLILTIIYKNWPKNF